MGYGLINEWTRILTGAGVPLTPEGLIAALQNPILHIRTGAAILLGRNSEAAAIPYLKSLLKDDLTVRVEAAMSLTLLKDNSGIPVLIEILDGDVLTGAPVTAAGYLADLGDPRGYRVVLNELGSRFTGNRLMAAAALKSFLQYHGKVINGQKVDLFPVLKKAFNDPETTVRFEILYKLAKLNDPRVPALLSEISRSDSDESVRQIAKKLLSSISNTPEYQKSLYSRIKRS